MVPLVKPEGKLAIGFPHVTPAKAGVQNDKEENWIPVFTGMTDEKIMFLAYIPCGLCRRVVDLISL